MIVEEAPKATQNVVPFNGFIRFNKQAKLGVDVGQVLCNHVRRNKQLFGYFRIRETTRNPVQYILLASCL
jgi:hypothetical protein